MLKKVILGMGLIGALTTSSFSEEVKLDKNFCKAYNFYTYKKFIQDSYKGSDSNRIRILKKSGDETLTAIYGSLSTDLIKETGIGHSINMNWGNILIAFDNFLIYTKSKEDKKELAKFVLNQKLLMYQDGINEDNLELKNEFLDENGNIDKQVFGKHLILTLDKKSEAGTFVHDFAQAKSKEKKIYSPFVKYVVNNDFERAREYIKQVNEESGINSIYQRFENACEK